MVFAEAELQRAHHKTDWHRYNLKRKVAELPPVTAEGFRERVLTQREAQAAGGEDKQPRLCKICRKQFVSLRSYENHLGSKRHRENEKTAKPPDVEVEADLSELRNKKNLQLSTKQVKEVESGDKKDKEEEEEETSVEEKKGEREEGGEEEEEGSDEPEALETNECLFCPRFSNDFEENLSHMSRVHGFFLPDLEYVTDPKGLVAHLCEKVGLGYLCLYCNERGKRFHCVEAAQQHMVDKCHCKMLFEGDAALDYAEFYDYSKSYPDYIPDDTKKDHPLPDARDTSLHVNEDLELVLPSGATAGHRSMRQLFKQRLPSAEHQKALMVTRVMSQYRALGWRGGLGGGGGEVVGVVQTQRDREWFQRMHHKREVRLGVKANKLQKHFRPQVVF